MKFVKIITKRSEASTSLGFHGKRAVTFLKLKVSTDMSKELYYPVSIDRWTSFVRLKPGKSPILGP